MKNLQLEQIPPYYEILMKVVNFTASLNLQYFFTFGLGSNIWEENLSESILSFFFVRLLKFVNEFQVYRKVQNFQYKQFEVNGIKVLQLETVTGAAIRV
ncbi:hypothetical protein E1A91_D09G063600v1 [Gossypium mustelinum]|uniref:Uncharacterized protein n=1 Tax=Gossypium mustelinum TaxID=34275 RepID=A0A5D2TIQ1_GOSMU|nr:hypothetical protein E1A91_D09G063600v1 [Gossypium mustelinum]TYI64105.1 hypothetical protein E1A91_D09G063600v1 [Gossypium mustelinum]TYI64106.1 hypothetical protein E1A91_D09G063600v1 [Gossypium mustelinum]TYI64107.1 hypothetical protein E1A91_D09G063600v1 [Gossypium mustelinum]TYI64110.1 hypothetical protein E1A91_D09G063600v1 [Gossypium mustelinum]